ncbi:MAG TPA: AI-2E family transporter [Terriglobales bacterium]|nr:AI-2E family transporter [Terriglobales bacterium]
MSSEPVELDSAQERELERPAVVTVPRARGEKSNVALSVIALILVLAACYFAKPVFVVLLVSILIAFLLAPVADLLERFRIPRPIASLISVLLMAGVLYGFTYYSYSAASQFVRDLPKYSAKMAQTVARFRKKAEDIQKTTQTVLPAPSDVRTVKVEQAPNWTGWLSNWAGSLTEAIFIISFIPFLVYFMLSWQEHVRASTVMLFRMENRNTAYVTLGEIARMIRAFIAGNVLVGLFMAAVASIIFGTLGLPYFYFIGLISGFVSLVPYLGVPLAVLPPLVAGLGQIGFKDALVIVASVFALHIFALNVLYPKIVGSRVRLNPLTVTLALLFWGWLWGAMGLVLAVPITAAMKIIFDHVEPLRPWGAWLGE